MPLLPLGPFPPLITEPVKWGENPELPRPKLEKLGLGEEARLALI